MLKVYINISLQGIVYFARRSGYDDEILRFFSNTLINRVRESSFDALYSQVARKWHQQDDIINPFHGNRNIHIDTVWTFDLDSDVLRFDKKDCNLVVSLSLIRQRPINISDFERYEPLTPLKHTLPALFSRAYIKMRRNRLNLRHFERRRAFIHRVLSDFAFQWRHILCGSYNNITFRKLASAIIRIATLNFDIEEITQECQRLDGFLVCRHSLPEWNPLNGDIVRVGGASIVITQHIRHAVTLIREDFTQRNLPTSSSHSPWEAPINTLTYLILTVQEVLLYRINNVSTSYTKPERMFNGALPPSDEAIELLLETTQPKTPTTPIHNIPVELQDMILDAVSAGSIERARVGCKLDLGSTFLWKCGNRDIEREEWRKSRTPWTPVESHIMFDNVFSGVAYK